MLTSDTKQKIETARKILVGRIPTPTGQVEQITLALIYKFMSDIDDQNVSLGAKPKFFTGDYKKYNWSNLIDLKLSSAERVLLYSEGLEKMNLNPNLPVFFRNIFKGAFLPFRDPEVLKIFLNKINEFSYSHSEELGNAFEYLLSVMDSQGDAGQFRTPRHIIDFIVDCVEPQKSDRILDPACGTAGFLISAYKYIMQKNVAKGSNQPGSALSFKERSNITNNFEGYDISHDMVRLSMVNMFLHNFPEPKIHEYDTLGSLDKWNDDFDCIFANPPFMSPSGGIRPHNRFSIQARRSEVLFVDYICEHLLPSGKAGIIVPEGIIFQSGKAYKQLRKMLVENYLWAVVSLPAGVFNPYAGVKTSILLIDKQLSNKSNKILFVKVENDGYDLGAQRRKINKNDLPESKKLLVSYKDALKLNIVFSPDYDKYLLISKDKIAAKDDYNLSMERYRDGIKKPVGKIDFVKLSDIAEVISGQSPDSKYYNNQKQGFPFYQGKTEFDDVYIGEPKIWTSKATKIAIKNDILMSVRAPVGPVNIATQEICIGRGLAAIRVNDKILQPFLFYYLKSIQDNIKGSGGAVFDCINRTQIMDLDIPLPPLSVQQEIVNKIDGYKSIINGARQIVENYKPQIDINPDWGIVELEKVCCKITDGTHNTPNYVEEGVPFLRVTDITESNKSKKYISIIEHEELIKRCKPQKGDILYSKNGTIGVAKLVDWNWEFSIFVSLCLIKPNNNLIDSKYLTFYLNSPNAYAQAITHSKSGTVTNLHLVEIKQIRVPLPSLKDQQQIVLRIEQEQKLIEAAKELINLYEQKIKDEISKIWE